MAFPKAGMLINGAPITISTILFPFAFLKSFRRCKDNIFINNILGKKYIIFVLIVTIITIINVNNSSLMQILKSIVLIGSPLAIYIGAKADYEKSMKIITISLLMVGAYALIQWIFGMLNTAIPGLTMAYGESLQSKPIGYGQSGFEAKKMPTTYQNGNLVAGFYIMAITSILTWTRKDKLYKKLKVIAIMAGSVGLLLSGARSTIVPVVGLIFFIILSYFHKLKRKHQVNFIISFFFLLSIIIIYLVATNSDVFYYFYERYILDTVENPTASGRTIQYQNLFSYIISIDFIEFFRLMLIGSPWNSAKYVEGFLIIFSFYGLGAIILLMWLVLTPVVKTYKFSKPVALSFLCVFISCMVDNLFLYPPVLINYFFIVGLVLKNNKRGINYLRKYNNLWK